MTTNRIINQKQYIPQYFSGTTNFGRKSCCEISKCGSGIDQIILKVVLPVTNLVYKPFFYYDLLSKIELVIGGKVVFKYNNVQLKLLSEIISYSTPDNTNYDCTIYCTLHLDKIFNKSKILKHGTNTEYLDLSCKGIRLCNLSETVKLYVKFSPITNLILSQNEKLSDSDTELIDAYILARYILTTSSNNEYCSTNECKNIIYQDYISCYGQELNPIINCNTVKYLINLKNNCEISELLIDTKSEKNSIKSYSLQINGFDCFQKFDAKEMNLIYQSNHKKILPLGQYAIDMEINVKNTDILQLNVWFENTEPIELYCMLKLYKNIIYNFECEYSDACYYMTKIN